MTQNLRIELRNELNNEMKNELNNELKQQVTWSSNCLIRKRKRRNGKYSDSYGGAQGPL